MSKSNVETACVPGYRAEVLPIYGCNGNTCKSHCWYFGGVKDRIAKVAKCLLCAEGKGRPHLHTKDLNHLPKTSGHVYSGHMGEIADLGDSEVRYIQSVIENHPGDIFQLFTHRPIEFYTKYPIWPENVWAMGTFTEGLIRFPPSLKAGKIVAYCEPVMGELTYDHVSRWPDWTVIGLLNHQSYNNPREIAEAVRFLMNQTQARKIPAFCKNLKDPRWRAMRIETTQQWPKGV